MNSKYQQMFLNNLQEKWEVFQEQQWNVDTDEVVRFFHQIAGTAGTIGLEEISKAAADKLRKIEKDPESVHFKKSVEWLLHIGNVTQTGVPQSLNISTVQTRQRGVLFLVDEDPLCLLYMRESLEHIGYHVVALTDPAAAFEQFYDIEPDCILLDMQSNREHTFEAISQYLDVMNQHFVPIILMSYDDSKENRLLAYESGADDFFVKNIEADELSLRISRHVQKKTMINRYRYMDELTKVYNKSYTEVAYNQFYYDLNQHETSFCMVLVTIDQFKEVNERYGHLKGDQLLITAADFLSGYINGNEVIIRHDGASFLLFLREKYAKGAQQRVKQIINDFSDLWAQGISEELILSMSSGLVKLEEKEKQLASALESVTKALAHAKHQGGNQLVVAGDHLGTIQKKINIAIVDDDEILRNILVRLITKIFAQKDYDVQVEAFREGISFLASDSYQQDIPCLVILDRMLPRLDGLSVLKRLKENPLFNTYVLMLTNRKNEEDIILALQSGADDYLTKPFKYEDLESRVAMLVKRMV